MSKIFKSKIFKTVAPIALSFIPGVGPLAGAALGAGIGAVGGGGLKGALLGAGGGYLGAGGLTSTAAGGLGATALGKAASSIGSSIGGGLSGILGTAGKALTTNGIPGGVGQIAGSGLLGGISSATGGLSSLLGGSGLSGGNLLTAASNIYSGVQGNAAVKDQTKALTKSNNQALALQSKMYDQTSANMNPFLTSGTAANSRLSDLLGVSQNTGAEGFGSLTKPFTMQDLQSDPGYQHRLAEGTRAMNQSLGARGSLFSGDALKAAQNFGQGLADQTYNDAYTRYLQQNQNTYNQLSGQAQNGQNAAGNLGATGQSYANQSTNLLSNQGNITAGGIQAGQNVTNQSLANIFSSPVGGFSGTQGLSPDQLINLKRQLGLA